MEHTYGYYDANYAVMNEHQLMFGECTDGAKVQLEPEPGKRIFYSAELSRVAAERCTTAREAVALIGRLIDTYGYYGTGETLPIAEPYFTCDTSKFSRKSAWWDFAWNLVARYDDGYINAPGKMAKEVGYPQEWYEKSKWPDGPTTYKRPESKE